MVLMVVSLVMGLLDLDDPLIKGKVGDIDLYALPFRKYQKMPTYIRTRKQGGARRHNHCLTSLTVKIELSLTLK